ncbi:hypothetical protein VTO73DRAFT_4999 [Trametes versicolor]
MSQSQTVGYRGVFVSSPATRRERMSGPRRSVRPAAEPLIQHAGTGGTHSRLSSKEASKLRAFFLKYSTTRDETKVADAT